MARPLTLLDPAPVLPPVTFDRWESFGAPWFEQVHGRPTDEERTARLAPFEHQVRTSPATPLQVAGPGRTSVVTFRGSFPTGVHRVPLPARVWLLRNGDDQWFGFNETHYWEAGALGPTFFPWWRADEVRVWDLRRPWYETRGLAGGGIPIWALTPSLEDLNKGIGGIRHSLAFSVAGNYSPEWVGAALRSDGFQVGHPLRSGELLRLTDEAYWRLLGETQRSGSVHGQAVVHALRTRGARVNDKTSATVGHNLRMPVGADLALGLKLSDFEVVLA